MIITATEFQAQVDRALSELQRVKNEAGEFLGSMYRSNKCL